MLKRIKVAYFGTPDFSVPSLEILKNHPHVDLKYVISMPDRPAGRGHQLKSPEAIEFAKQNKINFFQTENINKEELFLKDLEDAKIDVFFVLAFAQFLGDKLLNLPQIGCFNIHTSLLPKYRGAAPIQYAILNGDTETGVSIQKMVKKMDAGDIVFEKRVNIQDNETGGQLYTKLKFEAALSLNQFIYDIINNQITYKEQDESKVSFAPTLKREEGHIDFKNENLIQIKNKVQALYPWPGTYCFLNKKRLKIFYTKESDIKLSPGEISIDKNKFIIGCQDGSVEICDLQLEGKKRCLGPELINGLKNKEIIIS